jgi:hypothetical protein
MTRSEIKQIHRPLEFLQQLVPNDERSAADNLAQDLFPRKCCRGGTIGVFQPIVLELVDSSTYTSSRFITSWPLWPTAG